MIDEKKEAPLPKTSKEIVTTEQQEVNIDAFIERRKAFIEKVSAICVEGKDYHVIQGKKSLAKGGAEKIGSIFGWQAEFHKDTETLEMLGEQKGLVAYVCNLTKDLNFAGQGRGAAILSKNGNDPNKTIKMAQKSAFIDAVLRTSGLSDFFTQDLEDMDEKEISKPQASFNPVNSQNIGEIKPSKSQMDLIVKLMEQKNFTKQDLTDNNFTKLTGGKEGTASKLIDFLIKAKTKEPDLPTITIEQELKEKGDLETDHLWKTI